MGTTFWQHSDNATYMATFYDCLSVYKFGEKASPHILQKKNCCDLNLGESLCIVTFFLFSDSGLHLLNSFDFYFEWRDTENHNPYKESE